MTSTVTENVAKIRQATYGIETRQPIADSAEETGKLEEVASFGEGAITEINDRKTELLALLPQKDAEMAAKEPRIAALEAKHATRVNRYTNVEMQQEIEWIEKITHIIHDPPTMYTMIGDSTITAALISDDDYKMTDSGSSAALIDGEDYKMTADSHWSKQNIDDPTHEEYEYVIHWVPDYRLTFKRVNET